MNSCGVGGGIVVVILEVMKVTVENIYGIAMMVVKEEAEEIIITVKVVKEKC